jgi:hypothetical protein
VTVIGGAIEKERCSHFDGRIVPAEFMWWISRKSGPRFVFDRGASNNARNSPSGLEKTHEVTSYRTAR